MMMITVTTTTTTTTNGLDIRAKLPYFVPETANTYGCDSANFVGVYQTRSSGLQGVTPTTGLYGIPGFGNGDVFITEEGVGGPGTLIQYRDYRGDIENKADYIQALCVQPPTRPFEKICVAAADPRDTGGFFTSTADILDANCTAIDDSGAFRLPAFDSDNRAVANGWAAGPRIDDLPTS